MAMAESTYAIARLLATPQLDVDGADEPLPLARILVMGGDQVYPTASREDYQTKLVAPFDEAARGRTWDPKPHVYAVPGNHDWYDGLSAFLGLFCRRRTSSSWAVPRSGRIRRPPDPATRSYFAQPCPRLVAVGADISWRLHDQPQSFFPLSANGWTPVRA